MGDGALKGREVWPAWVAAVCGSNIARAEAGSTEALLRDVKAMRHSSRWVGAQRTLDPIESDAYDITAP